MSMDTERTFTPADIAKELGVTTNSIRNWTRRYSDFLSDSAAPKPGAQRALTQRDRIVLAYINGLLNDGHRHEYIATRLAETSFSDDEATPADLLASVTKAAQVPATALPAAPAADQVTAIAAMLADAHVKQLDDIRGRLSQLEAQQAEQGDSRSRLLVGITAGFVAGAVLVGIAAMLVLMLR